MAVHGDTVATASLDATVRLWDLRQSMSGQGRREAREAHSTATGEQFWSCYVPCLSPV